MTARSSRPLAAASSASKPSASKPSASGPFATLRRALPLAIAAALLTVPAAANPDWWKREGWATDFTMMSVEPDSIQSGGPPKDGIPSIDDPRFVPVAEATYDEREPVVGLEIDGDARAYPLSILTWHEIVNDTVGGTPVIVTYCPLCNAAITFERTLDGEAVEFGTTGKLRNSDLIMYDRASETWWQQFTGEAIAGERLGERLTMVPSRLESWGQFKARHPGGRALVPTDPSFRDYGRNPYVSYDSAATPFLYRGSMPKGVEPMARVVVVRDGNRPHVVTMDAVREAGSLELGGATVSWTAGQASALDAQRIVDGRDVGTILAQRDGVDVPYDVTFAFVAHAFHPEAEIRTE